MMLEAVEMKSWRVRNKSEQQGNVITKKFRVVCQSCNNGWMSRLETAVKPTILSFLSEGPKSIDKHQANALALWITTKTIVGEHAEKEAALTPSEDRELVFREGKIPTYFRIYLGVHSSETKAGYHRHSTTVSLAHPGLAPRHPPGIKRNVQTVMFLVGSILVYVISARVPDLDPDSLFKLGPLIRIWPTEEETFNLDISPFIDDKGIRTISNLLNSLTSSEQVRYGGPLLD
jgi:hypothetical protein